MGVQTNHGETIPFVSSNLLPWLCTMSPFAHKRFHTWHSACPLSVHFTAVAAVMLAALSAPVHARTTTGMLRFRYRRPRWIFAPGGTGTYRLRVSTPPTRNSENGSGWWIRVYADGNIPHGQLRGTLQGFSWIPSEGLGVQGTCTRQDEPELARGNRRTGEA